jgi:hypothetical protein
MLGYPVPGGNKYRNLDLQIGRVSKTGTRYSDLRKAAPMMLSKN